jgi:hypothetical protein
VYVKDEMSTGEPDTRDTLDRFSDAPDVPTSPSRTVAPPDAFALYHDAVPVATALTDAGSPKSTTPDAAEPAAPSVTVAKRVPVAASFAVAGAVPERISNVPPDRSVPTASAFAFCVAVASFVVAMC